MDKKPTTILIIGFGGKGVGDQIIATPFIRNLKSNFPDARIDYGASSQMGVDLLFSDPHLSDCFVLDMDCFKISGRITFIEKITIINSLRARHYDMVYVLNSKMRAAVAAFLTGAKERIGIASYHREFLLSKYWQESIEKNLVDRFLDLLAFDGLSVEANHIMLYLEPSETAAAIGKLRHLFPDDRPVVALAPFAADMRRTWGLDCFVELAGRCCREGWGVVILGSASDRSQMIKLRWGADVVDLVGVLSIRETAAVISEASAFAGNDSGLAHVAGAVSTPGVVIGYHVTKVWYPSAPSIQTVIKDPGCTSCDLNSCFQNGTGQPPCFAAVSVEEIFERLKSLKKD